jgi:hypothetical protein
VVLNRRRRSQGQLCPSEVCIRDLQGWSKGDKCCRAHGQQDLPALLQLPFGRGKATLEQDPGQGDQLQSVEGLKGHSSQYPQEQD